RYSRARSWKRGPAASSTGPCDQRVDRVTAKLTALAQCLGAVAEPVSLPIASRYCAAAAHPLGGAGHPATPVADGRDVAGGGPAADDLAALVSECLLLRDGWSRQQRQHDRKGDRPHCAFLSWQGQRQT